MRLGSGNPKIIVGIFKSVGGGFGNYCSGAGSGLKYGVYGYDSSGFNDYNLCLSVPDSDVNLPMTMLVVRNNTTCNEGDGQLDEYLVQWSFNDFSNFTCVDNENPNGYNRMQLQEDITDSNVTGHQVWGSHWTGSSWVNVSDTFVNQSRGVDFLTARNPPQMFWYIEPAPGNNGGQMTTCVYDTGVGCNFGS